jgi:hypothetical protein
LGYLADLGDQIIEGYLTGVHRLGWQFVKRTKVKEPIPQLDFKWGKIKNLMQSKKRNRRYLVLHRTHHMNQPKNGLAKHAKAWIGLFEKKKKVNENPTATWCRVAPVLETHTSRMGLVAS